MVHFLLVPAVDHERYSTRLDHLGRLAAVEDSEGVAVEREGDHHDVAGFVPVIFGAGIEVARCVLDLRVGENGGVGFGGFFGFDAVVEPEAGCELAG